MCGKQFLSVAFNIQDPSDFDFEKNIFGKNRSASFVHGICDTEKDVTCVI